MTTCAVRLVLVATLAAVVAGRPAVARAELVDRAGAPIANTDATLEGHLTAAPGCRAGQAGAGCRVLAEPASPADDDPAALGALGTPGAPEDDLAAALAAMADAADPAAAARAVGEARSILAGDPLPGRAYSGIPLLNWNAPAKVRRVPAGGEVTVTVVRTPQQVLSDTWLLDFEDAAQPYTITYRVSELGGALGGELRPTPLLADGELPLGGLHSALVPLVPPPLDTGTTLANRFTDARGLPAAGAEELGRAAVQTVSVRMPPPRVTAAVLEPGTQARDAAPLELAPATVERIAAARDALGFFGDAPTPAERDRAIARLAPGAPERLLWDDLAGLAGVDGEALLSAARSLGAQDAGLVDAMRTRSALPAGVSAPPAADVTVVFQNGETYVSRATVRATPGEPLRVQVVNRDGFDRRVEALALHGRRAVFGPEDWGTFDWSRAGGAALAAHRPSDAEGDSQLLSLEAPADTFALWIDDPAGGDQAAARIDVETGPVRESVRLSPSDGALPAHAAFGPDGDLWVALAGVDEVVRVTPGERLAESAITTHLIPGGAHSATSTAPPQGPTDVAVDERGLVWVTLAAGNGLARVDPNAVQDGTEGGIRKYALPACPNECAPVFAAAPGELPTREPLQLDVSYDSDGTALVWFTESAADSIGLLRVAPDGELLGQTHFACGCGVPRGLTLDADGDVWFTEAVDNRIGRLTPSTTDVASAAGARLRHYAIPSGVPLMDPELSPEPVTTSNPHSVIVDRQGRMWFSESATGKVGRLDPTAARPGSSDGIVELDLPDTFFGADPVPADLAADRAGTIFWADEYGDAVGAIDAAGEPGTWRARPPWRPAARRSLTDSPVLDDQGDLYFVESGAGLLTRIKAAGAGQPRPAAPPRVTLDLAGRGVRVEGLAEADRVDVAVVRDGRVVAAIDGVAVVDGAATAGADALQAGDVVRITPRGAQPRAAIAVAAADITATLDGDVLTGRALLGGSPAAGAVEVPGTSLRAPIDAATGAFALRSAPAATRPQTAALVVARPGAVTRTIVPVAAPPARPDPGTPQQPTTPVTPAPPATPVTPAPPATPVTPAPPATPVTPAPPARPPARPAGVCARGRWVIEVRRRPTPWLLGLRAGEVEACLGAPSTHTRRRLRYAPGLVLALRARRVAAVTVTGRRWTSSRGGLRVGARSAAVRRALPRARRRGRTWGAALRLPGRTFAQVRIDTDRGVRATRIVARLVDPPALGAS